MGAAITVGFWVGILVAVAVVAHWGPGLWRRVLASSAGIWIVGGACAAVVVLVVGGLWAAGQMSSGTPYP